MFWKLFTSEVPPDTIFTIPGINFPVTNTLLCTWLIILGLIILVFGFMRNKRHQQLVPSGFQNFMEWAVESLQNLVEGVSGKVKGRKFFPLVATLFIFIFLANFTDVLPGIDTIGSVKAGAHTNAGFFHLVSNSGDLVGWFRPPTTDLNLTFAMAVIVVVLCQIIGFWTLGAGSHLGKYFKFKGLFSKGVSGPIEFFVGLIEIVTEVSRVLSFAFRLFGNIFAGSAVLAVFGWLTLGLANVIFIPLELFVAFVQALVFAMLTLVFMEMATTAHDHEHETPEEAFVDYEQKEERQLAATH